MKKTRRWTGFFVSVERVSGAGCLDSFRAYPHVLAHNVEHSGQCIVIQH